MMVWHHFENVEEKIRITISSFVLHDHERQTEKFCNLEAFELIALRITMENMFDIGFVWRQIL